MDNQILKSRIKEYIKTGEEYLLDKHVLKEIEEKTPILQQQQVEYQTMVSSQQRLTQMYTQVSK